ncbi:hypothetical protein AD998_17485 [bacterium 336/3]|nr:hypothetical protein AD998_17485 [bacterium 336/3]
MYSITCIICDENGNSVFIQKTYPKSERSGMYLSEQIGSKNFRIRESDAYYKSFWHLAGDPTLIIVLQGILRITLQNNQYMDFCAGDMFIAADNLPIEIQFDPAVHGHMAEVISEVPLRAIHVKLLDFKV